jgi:tryptophanyl-tRNA synthetase
VIDRIVEEVTGMRQRAQEYEDNPDLVRGIIAEGCEKARAVAGQTLDDVKQAMGLAYR